MKQLKTRLLGILLMVCITLSACGKADKLSAYQLSPSEITMRTSEDSATNIENEEASVTEPEYEESEEIAITSFGLKLLQNSYNNTLNTLISPISVLYALGMTANGAKEDTLLQIEQVLGIPLNALNGYLSEYAASLPSSVKLANSIWFRDDDFLSIKDDFLQKCTDYYHAELYKVPFNNTTADKINSWVSEHTDEMIKEVLKQIPDSAVMYLINAVVFDAEWQTIYDDYQIREGEFTTEDGTRHNVDFMYSSENLYLEDENETGFLKYYKDQKYAYVALLPNEGITVEEYLKSLTGEKLNEMLNQPTSIEVRASIPKYKGEYSTDLKEVLQSMGMMDAFDENNANLTDIGSSERGNLHISSVIHKTYIEVDERGTKAGAVTVVAVQDCCAAIEPQEFKTVYLDRPFVYLLIDCENNLPIFMGTVMDITE